METETICRMPKHVQALLANRTLLEDHVIFDEKVYEKLALLRVIPPTIIRDVRNAPRDEKVDILVSHVSRLGPRSVRRLCDALQATGHSMVAEHLRFNSFTEQSDPSWFIQTQERFPGLRRVFTQFEMKEFYQFLQEKIDEQIAKRMWLVQSRERAQLHAERNNIIATDIRQHNVIRDKKEQIKHLVEDLKQEQKEIEKLQKNIVELRFKSRSSEAAHIEQYNVLIQTNKACERSQDIMQNRLDIFNTQIKRMNIRIRKIFGEDSANVENDLSNIKVSKLEDNLERLFAHIGRLERDTKRVLNKHKAERKRLIDALGIEDSRQDLSTAYQQSTGDLAEILHSTHVILTKLLTHVYTHHSITQMVNRRTNPNLSSNEKISGNRLVTLAHSCMDKVRLLELHATD